MAALPSGFFFSIRKQQVHYLTLKSHVYGNLEWLHKMSLDKKISLAVRFHLGHLFEMQNKCQQAQEMYDAIIETPGLPNTVKANAYKQLGEYILRI